MTPLLNYGQEQIMRSDITPGGTFPDYELPDHENVARKLSEIQGEDPLIRPDWDLSKPGLREAWDAGDYSPFHGWNKRSPQSTPTSYNS